MFDLDSFVANAPLIIADRDNRADVQNVLTIFAEKVGQNYVVKAKWSDIFAAFLQGKKVQAQVLTFVPADEEEETDASASVETFDIYDVSVSGGSTPSFKANGNDLSASDADSFPVGSLSRPSSGGGGGGSMFVITQSGSPLVFDKTWKEITDAFEEGSIVVLKTESSDVEGGTSIWHLSEYGAVEQDGQDGATIYYVCFISGNGMNVNSTVAEATAEDDYPSVPY